MFNSENVRNPQKKSIENCEISHELWKSCAYSNPTLKAHHENWISWQVCRKLFTFQMISTYSNHENPNRKQILTFLANTRPPAS